MRTLLQFLRTASVLGCVTMVAAAVTGLQVPSAGGSERLSHPDCDFHCRCNEENDYCIGKYTKAYDAWCKVNCGKCVMNRCPTLWPVP
jgi:hypothetical protein